MKKLAVIASFCLAGSLLAVPTNIQTTPAPLATQEAQKDRFTSTDDHKLGGQIRVQIAEILGVPNSNAIVLVVDHGDVKLTGTAPSEELKTKISQHIQQIKGIKSVHNKLEVLKK